MGNELLARGPGGLGATTRVVAPPDRDTWLDTGTRVTGPVLLVANTVAFQAVTHFRVASWHVPDTTLTSLSIRSVTLVVPAMISGDNQNTPTAIPIQLGIDSLQTNTSGVLAPWDSTKIAWPGPGTTATVGDSTFDTTEGDTLFIRLPMPPSVALDSLKWWRAHPDWLGGFQLRAASPVPGSVAAFKAGALQFRVAYDYTTASGHDTTAILETPVTTDLYVRTPATALATGGESTLRLGGYVYPSIAMHFPVPDLPAGAAINEGAVLLHVDEATSTAAFLTGKVTVDLQVRTLEADWTESRTDTTNLAVTSAPATTVASYAYEGLADSLIAIRLPVAMIRGWRATTTANYGLLITALRGDAAPVILIDSRESAHPPQLRLSYTTPPGGRF